MPPCSRRSRPVRALLLALLALTLPACSPGASGSDQAGDVEPCRGDEMTAEPGRLTLSTGPITRSPWVAGGDQPGGTGGRPGDGLGYDAAVGYALAGRIGFAADQVTWVATPFAEAVSPGDKAFDVHLEQATITDERREAVDLSEPYYVMRQAVVALAGRPATSVDDLDGLRDVRLAVLDGSPTEELLGGLVELDGPPTGHDDLDRLRGAVSSGAQDAMVVDFQTALELDRTETLLVDGELVGQLPRGPEPAESYGLVLQKDSALTPCVDAALVSLGADGSLERLEREWLMERPGFPELR